MPTSTNPFLPPQNINFGPPSLSSPNTSPPGSSGPGGITFGSGPYQSPWTFYPNTTMLPGVGGQAPGVMPLGWNGSGTSGALTAGGDPMNPWWNNSRGGGNLGPGFPSNPLATSTPIPLTQPGSRTVGNVVYSTPGSQETQLDSLFSNAVGGTKGGQALGNQLHSLAMGILPQPMADWITASTNEQFGKLGSRFGSDLGNAIAQGLGVAGSQQSLAALNELFNLGGTTAGFQFERGENALNRAVQTYGIDKQSQSSDQTFQLLNALLGGGLG